MNTTNARAALLDRVIHSYAHHGVLDTSMRSLASALGTSQRMLHYHFGSRENLLAAVVEEVVTQEVATLEVMSSEGGDPFDTLMHHWARVRRTAQTFGPLYFELATHAMYRRTYAARLPPVLVTRYQSAFAAIYATVAGPALSSRLARLTLAVGRGLLFDAMLDGDADAADTAAIEFRDMVRDRIASAQT